MLNSLKYPSRIFKIILVSLRTQLKDQLIHGIFVDFTGQSGPLSPLCPLYPVWMPIEGHKSTAPFYVSPYLQGLALC